MPVRKGASDGIEPGRDASFTAIDFLSPSHQTDHHRPVLMPIKVGNEEFRLGLVEANLLLLSAHEVRGHFLVPSSLGFVKYDHAIAGSSGFPQAGVSEVMH